MRLAMRLPGKPAPDAVANDIDPREELGAEVIDLASRTAYPTVTQRKGKSDGLGLAAGVAVIGLLGAFTLWSMDAARNAPAHDAPVAPAQPAAAQAPAIPATAMAPAQPGQSAPAPRQYDPAPQPVLAAMPNSAAAAMPAGNRLANATLVYDAGGLPVAVAAPGESPAATGNGAADFASRIGGVGGGTAQAQRMVNPATTVTQGTLIPAVLETAIDTNVPGFVRAVVSQDVRSFDGSRVLLPRSSRLIGQYQSGLQGGQRRAYVIWTRVIRPDGVSVNLASPAIGFDGTTGLEGKISGNGFFKRFGSAMLLSVVGGLGTVASGGAGGVIVGGASQSAASTAAQQDGQRGPTVRVRQGEPIRVFTARDLDFSQVS